MSAAGRTVSRAPAAVPSVALAALVLVGTAAAQDPAPAPSPFLSVDAFGSVDAEIDAFLAERGWQRGECACNPAGGVLVVAEADVAVPADRIGFSEARLLATEEAYLKAIGAFARQDAVEIVKDSTREFMKDDLPRELGRESDLGALVEAVSARLATASVAQLDRLVESVGGDASDLPRLDLAERRVRLRDELTVHSLSRAAARMAGVGIFGVIESAGGGETLSNGSVGVVVVRAPGFEDLGRQLRRGESDPSLGMPVEAARRTIADSLAGRVPMLGHFGVQPVRDAEGRYGLLSFGVAAPQLTASIGRDLASAELEAARTGADLAAEGWLAQFATLAVEADREEFRRKLKERVEVAEGDGFLRGEGGTDVGRMLSDVTRSVSRARLRGVQTLGRWSADDPLTGHPYVGVVKYWSPATAAGAERLSEAYREGVRPARPAAARPAPRERTVRSTGTFGQW